MAELDRQQDYSEVFGLVEDGHRYSQNGLRFDAQGIEIVDATVAVAVKPEVKGKTKPKAAPTAAVEEAIEVESIPDDISAMM